LEYLSPNTEIGNACALRDEEARVKYNMQQFLIFKVKKKKLDILKFPKAIFGRTGYFHQMVFIASINTTLFVITDSKIKTKQY